MELISHSEKETQALAAKLAEKSNGGTVLALVGDLGSGKTAFAKGFAAGLGVTETVASPTYVILKVYQVSGNKQGITQLAHFDLYRLASFDDAEGVGLAEIINDKDTISLIEWPEKAAPLLNGREVRKLYFEYLSENDRKITYDDTIY